MLSAAEVDLTEDEVRLLIIAARLLCIVKAHAERSPFSEGDQKIWDSRLAKERCVHCRIANVYTTNEMLL